MTRFVIKIVTIIGKAKIYFFPPEHSDIVIFDNVGSDHIKSLLFGNKYSTLHVRNEVIYILVVILSIRMREFWRGRFREAYIYTAIKLLNPKVLITFIHNNIEFYSISKRFKNIKTIAITNGVPTEMAGDLFFSLKSSKEAYVDCIFVPGSIIANNLSKYLCGEILSSGSLISNEYKKQSYVNHSTGAIEILFISQFIQPSNFKSFINKGKLITHSDFYKSEMLILKYLKNYIIRSSKKIKLSIASRYICNNVEIDEEFEFFTNNLIGLDFNFLSRIDKFSTYRYIDKSDVIVSIDSFAGYESIGRGNKTAMMSIRGEFINEESYKFGWGSKIGDHGLFWMNKDSEENFGKILDFLVQVTDVEWEHLTRNIKDSICCYNNANILIKDKINFYLNN